MADTRAPIAAAARFVHGRLLWLLIGAYAVAALWPGPGLRLRDASLGTVTLAGPGVRLSPRGEYEITDAVSQLAARGRFEVVEKLPTAKLARTCFFDPESGRLFLGVPRQAGKPGPEVRVYQARP